MKKIIYYLIGAQDGADTMQTWRVDRLCDLEIMDALYVIRNGQQNPYAELVKEVETNPS